MEILNKIQRELKAPKNQRNTFGNYNYRSCEDILEAVKPLLGEATLTITDEIVLIGDRHYVRATATLTCGEHEKSVSAYARETIAKKGMDEAQITGAASSYARKYALNGLFCIDDNRDTDIETECITSKQAKQIKDKALELKVDNALFLSYMGIKNVEEMPKSMFKKAMIALETKANQKTKE